MTNIHEKYKGSTQLQCVCPLWDFRKSPATACYHLPLHFLLCGLAHLDITCCYSQPSPLHNHTPPTTANCSSILLNELSFIF